MKQKEIIPWFKIETDSLSLSQKLPSHIAYIVPVARGGLVPATIIAYALRKPILGVITTTNEFMTSDRHDIAIVDDVCDTGHTFLETRKRFPKACYAALYIKPHGMGQCDRWVAQVEQSTWLVFPWGRDDVVNR